MDKNYYLTIWQDGTWKIWRQADAGYAANDPNWCVNLPFVEIQAEIARQENPLAALLLGIELGIK